MVWGANEGNGREMGEGNGNGMEMNGKMEMAMEMDGNGVSLLCRQPGLVGSGQPHLVVSDHVEGV